MEKVCKMNCAKCELYLSGEVDMIPCALNILVNKMRTLEKKVDSMASEKKDIFRIANEETEEIEDNEEITQL